MLTTLVQVRLTNLSGTYLSNPYQGPSQQVLQRSSSFEEWTATLTQYCSSYPNCGYGNYGHTVIDGKLDPEHHRVRCFQQRLGQGPRSSGFISSVLCFMVHLEFNVKCAKTMNFSPSRKMIIIWARLYFFKKREKRMIIILDLAPRKRRLSVRASSHWCLERFLWLVATIPSAFALTVDALSCLQASISWQALAS